MSGTLPGGTRSATGAPKNKPVSHTPPQNAQWSGSGRFSAAVRSLMIPSPVEGIYLFWGMPKIIGWIVENTEFMDEE